MENHASKAPSLLEQLNSTQFSQMFELLTNELFWVKDKEGRFVYVNEAFLRRSGKKHIDDVLNKTDFDIAPRYIAKQFIADDLQVLNGKAISDRLELNILQDGELIWMTTSKRPILTESGEIIGSYGISRLLEKSSKSLASIEIIKTPVEYIRNNYMNDISISDLAQVACLSVSALERRFKKYLLKTPKQVINEIRLENARRMILESNDPIASIASKVGFSDHSYFSRQFHKQFGELPSEFRTNSLQDFGSTLPQ